jgi:hypothetical protein
MKCAHTVKSQGSYVQKVALYSHRTQCSAVVAAAAAAA